MSLDRTASTGKESYVTARARHLHDRSGARRTARLALAALWASLIVLSTSAAQAAVTHNYLSQITEVPATGPLSEAVPFPGPLTTVDAMSVDSGDLYLVEQNGGESTSRLDTFDAASGDFLSQFPEAPSLSFLYQGVAVGHATGETEVYVGGNTAGTHGALAVFDPSGALQAVWNGANTPDGAFGCFACNGVGDVAVDNSAALTWASGDVYVAAPEKAVVDVFTPLAGGEEPSSPEIHQLTGTCPTEGTTCEPAEVIPFSKPTHVAVSAYNGDVLVADGSEERCANIAEAPACALDTFEPVSGMPGVYRFLFALTGTPAGDFAHISDIAVDANNGDFYVSDSQAHVVYQFDSAGKYLTRLTSTPTAPFGRAKSVAVDPASGNLYVGDYDQPAGTGAVEVFGPSLIVPDVETEAASPVRPLEATLNGTVDPLGAGGATCQFVWGTSAEFGHAAPCTAAVPEGTGPAAVTAELSGLEPDTTYFYRLQATNQNGTNPGEPSQDHEFTTPGPGLHSTSASNVKSTSSTLEATIDPHGAPTSYYFQYGTDASYGAEVPAPPGAAIGEGQGDLDLAQHIQGLAAHTTYHYRVVARSEWAPGEVEEFPGPDHTFTTQTPGPFALPDARQWELVSPPDKHGANILGPREGNLASQAAAGGEAITYLASAATEADPQGFSNVMQVLSTRGAGGWGSLDIGVPHPRPTGVATVAEYRLFSADLSLGAVHPLGPLDPSISAQASEQTSFLRTDFPPGDRSALCTASCYRPLVSGCPEAGPCPPGVEEVADVPPGTVFGGEPEGKCPGRCGPEFFGASPDFGHVVLRSKAALGATPVEGGLYEWTAGKLQLLSLLPGDEGGAAVGASLGSLSSNSRVPGAISTDGSRVIFSAPATGGLYMRLNPMQAQSPLDAEGRCTVAADACTVRLDPGGEPRFQAATPDASKAFFTVGGDLYEYDTGEREFRALTEGANLQGAVLGAGEDGSRVYFVAKAALSGEEENEHGERAAAGQPNLYLSEDGSAKFLAVLSSADAPDWGLQKGEFGDGAAATTSSRVSPDGAWLAFMSERPLTGSDNRDANSGHRDEQVYLYDAASDRLLCPSCNPTGARPAGSMFGSAIEEQFEEAFLGANRAWSGAGNSFAALIPGWITPRYQSRYLADSGRLFFDSHDALAPQDSNGTWDVYQYEPPGDGECTEEDTTFDPASGGCVGLISSGSSAEPSAFLDASQTGDDVFFLTSAQLSSRDLDTSVDVYDAHACSAESPCLPAPPPPAPVCEGDACQSPAVPPFHPTPGTALLNGPGNALECPKGKKKKQGKCVPKKSKKHKKKGKKHTKKRASSNHGGDR